jgi:hypothetical protein
MPRPGTTRHRAPERDRDDCYPDDLLPDLQRTLAALADVELCSEAARERLEHEPPGSENRFWSRSRPGYRLECQPHVQRLEQLRERMRAWIMPGL